jgi:hypothetical protein
MRGKKPCHQCGTQIAVACRTCTNCRAEQPRSCQRISKVRVRGYSTISGGQLLASSRTDHGHRMQQNARSPQAAAALRAARMPGIWTQITQQIKVVKTRLLARSRHSLYNCPFSCSGELCGSVTYGARPLCTSVNSRKALCFGVAGHTAASGNGNGMR